MKNITLYIFFLFSIVTSTAQEVSVKASVDRDRILIGEPIQLILEAKTPSGATVKWFASDTLPHFEFIEQGKIDSSKSNVYKQTFIITSFDSGRQIIQPLPLEVNGQRYLTDSIPVTVSFTDFDPKQDYHDIKDILEVEAEGFNYLQWGLIAAGILLLLLLIWYLYKISRRKIIAPPSEVFSHLSPLEEALQALDTLKQEHLSEKQFYTGLNDIIRWFVYRKTGVAAMQKTNEEFILQVEKLGMPHDDFIALAQTLRMFDVVKFAKFIPRQEDKERAWQVIRSSVQSINNRTK